MSLKAERMSAGTFLVIIAFVAFSLFTSTQMGRLERENSELKDEIAEWQRAAMPVLHSRGWKRELMAEEIQPRDLRESLDPCHPVSFRGRPLKNTQECASMRAAPSYGSLGEPIEVKLAENWP